MFFVPPFRVGEGKAAATNSGFFFAGLLKFYTRLESAKVFTTSQSLNFKRGAGLASHTQTFKLVIFVRRRKSPKNRTLSPKNRTLSPKNRTLSPQNRTLKSWKPYQQRLLKRLKLFRLIQTYYTLSQKSRERVLKSFV